MASNLPPGCGLLPGEEGEGYCVICGEPLNFCECPECPECGSVGDPKCYYAHGLKAEPVDPVHAKHVGSLVRLCHGDAVVEGGK